MGERRRFRQGKRPSASRNAPPRSPCARLGIFHSSCRLVVLQHRRLLYELFSRNYRVKRSAVQARLAQEFGDVSKAEVDRLFHVSEAPGVERACTCRVVKSGVAAGVLQQLRWDVVPEGNHPVLTVTPTPHPPPPPPPQADDRQPITAPGRQPHARNVAPQQDANGNQQFVFLFFFLTSCWSVFSHLLPAGDSAHSGKRALTDASSFSFDV